MKKIVIAIAISFLASCASQDRIQIEKAPVLLKPSFIEETREENKEPAGDTQDADLEKTNSYTSLSSFSEGYKKNRARNLAQEFDNRNELSVTVDAMPIADFMHYALGEQLDLNYILANDLPVSGAPVTLNLKDSLSSRRFFSIVQDVLGQRNIQITEKDNVYYVVKTSTSGKGRVDIGIGRNPEDVPNSATQILQIVPTKYGISTTLERTIGELVDIQLTPDFQQSALFLKGRRSEVIRALELVNLLDLPLNRGKHVGIVNLVYVSADEFVTQAKSLLENEGVTVGVGNSAGQNIVFVPLLQLGAVAVFSNNMDIVNRVRYWSRQLDKPARNSDSQYYMYTPKFARAADLGDSILPLISGQNRAGSDTSRDQTQNANTNQQGTARGNVSSGRSTVSNLSMVVDERSNSLIFHGSGKDYQSLLPLIHKLDVLPKQVLLDITIAEVRLQDEFSQGVEVAINNLNTNTNPANTYTFGGGITEGFGGISYTYQNLDTNIVASLLDNDSLVNILSNPTLVVRDGVVANLSVGDDVPVISSTTQGSDIDIRNTTQFQYRSSGLELSVKPTVNAQNIVLMEIRQYLSNQSDTTTSGSNPSFFERTIETEVVARSGQTILLGGIISENSSRAESGVPVLRNIPFIGNAFKGKSSSSDKTELVVLVTARVLDNTDEWQDIKTSFQEGLDSIKITN